MTESNPPPSIVQPDARWWESDGTVSVRLAGAFEGGGAKGVAYPGALRATRAKGCWFGAVAGASGAITAALITAGRNGLAVMISVPCRDVRPQVWEKALRFLSGGTGHGPSA